MKTVAFGTQIKNRLQEFSSIPAISDGNKSLNYSELVDASMTLAETLESLGVTPHFPIAIELPRSCDLAITLVASTLKEWPWLILNPSWSESKKQRLLEITHCQAHIKLKQDVKNAQDIFLPQINANISFREIDSFSALASNIAYLATSSGSSGEPKCAILPFEGLLALMKNQSHYFDLQTKDRVLLMASPGFDAVVSELFVSLWSGASITITNASDNYLATAVEGLLASRQIDFVTMTPSVAKVLKPSSLLNLKTLVLAGEAAPKSLVQPLLNKIRIINAYGPCEVSVCSHMGDVTSLDLTTSIGSPMPHIYTRILDENGGEVVANGSGELHLYGEAVAFGYLGGDNSAFGIEVTTGLRSYRTGDLVRVNADGTCHFIGRKDAQVKVRGQKVNLIEISEKALATIGVEDAYAIDVVDEEQTKIVLFFKGSASEEAVLEVLKRELPPSAIPRLIKRVVDFSLNSSGKIDVLNLKTKALDQFRDECNQKKSAMLGNESANKAALIWEDVLGTKPKDENENFFDAGGNSLLIALIFGKFQEECGRELPLSEFIANPTPRTLQSLLEETTEEFRVEDELKSLFGKIASWKNFNQDLPLAELNTIVLTGASGKVGRSTLNYLIKATSATIICLGRSDALKFVDNAAEHKPRLYSYHCDFVDAQSIKSALQKVSLKHSVDAIIHCGAQVNHVYPLKDLFAANVHSTFQFLEYANLTNVRRFIYISTLSAAAYTDRSDVANGYDQSKGCSEQLVLEAKKKGLDATVVRLPLVYDVKGSTREELEKDHFIARIKECIRLNSYPDIDASIPILDAADCAKIISNITFHKENLDSSYDLLVDDGYNWKKLFSCELAKLCATRVSYESWRQHFLNTPSDSSPLRYFATLYRDQAPFSTNMFPAMPKAADSKIHFMKFLIENPIQSIQSSRTTLMEILRRTEILSHPKTEQNTAHVVDIWYESTQLPTEAYRFEKALLKHQTKLLSGEITETKDKLSVSELWEGQPHRFFMFEIDGRTYVGQKLLSPLITVHGSPGLFCSLVKPEMLLGELVRVQTSQEGVEIFYKPFALSERLKIYETLSNGRGIDLYYPFNQMSKTDRKEVNTPEEGWFITEERAEILGLGEVHLRRASVDLVLRDGLKNPVVYDPACSTGQFLSSIKAAVPGAYVIGQDLSAQMCSYAAPKLDEVIIGNSMEPGVADNSCDYVFFRFLNSEVVTTTLAAALFKRLSQCLKPTGKAILFGHTPVLVSKALMEMEGFNVLSCNERLPNDQAVFQFYVLERK